MTETAPRFCGTSDICFYIAGEFAFFHGDAQGIEAANQFFEKNKMRIKSMHFGESCYLLIDGKPTIGMVRLTRREFYSLVQNARGIL